MSRMFLLPARSGVAVRHRVNSGGVVEKGDGLEAAAHP